MPPFEATSAAPDNILNRPADIRRIKRWQMAAYWASRLLGRFLRLSGRIDLPTTLRDDVTYLIASTHQSQLDPFIVCGQLPPKLWRQLYPVRYMVHPGLWRRKLKRTIMINLGCFTTKPFGNYPHGLEFATSCLNQNETVFIFPEGKRTTVRLPARRGVSELAQNPKVQIIPIRVQWDKRPIFRTFDVVIGKPFSGVGLSADEILDRIYAL